MVDQFVGCMSVMLSGVDEGFFEGFKIVDRVLRKKEGEGGDCE